MKSTVINNTLNNIIFKKLPEFERFKIDILLSLLISEGIIVIDTRNLEFENEELENIFEFINDVKTDVQSVIILDNKFSNICKKTDLTLVVKEDKIEYLDETKKLRILEDLIILEFADTTEVLQLLKEENITHFESGYNKIIVRSKEVENLVYKLLKININVISIKKYNDVFDTKKEEENV